MELAMDKSRRHRQTDWLLPILISLLTIFSSLNPFVPLPAYAATPPLETNIAVPKPADLPARLPWAAGVEHSFGWRTVRKWHLWRPTARDRRTARLPSRPHAV